MKHIFCCLTLCMGFISFVQAQDWSGRGEAGLIRASGNTDSENFNVGLSFARTKNDWQQEFGVGLYRASANDIDSADSVFADLSLKRDLSERRFLFAGLNYLDDKFDGFTEQTSVSAGYGYRIIKNDPNLWEVSMGLGYRDTAQAIRLVDGSEQEGEDVSGITLVLTTKLVRQITSNTQFVDEFRADIGSDNTFVENDASLHVAMNDAFALKLGFLIRHNSDPAPGADDTDTITTVNLVYNFSS